MRAFLARFAQAAEVHGINFWDAREKNKAFIDETGFIRDDLEKVIESLRYENYNDGPDPDYNSSRSAGEVWEFSREFMGYDLYIKLKLIFVPAVGEVPPVCMSFHAQEASMRTPLRRRWGG